MKASELLGITVNPPGSDKVKAAARQALAYFKMRPYPGWGFRDWKTEDRGPLPKCRSHAKTIVERSAKWLFGKPITFKCENEQIQQRINEIWQNNSMPSKAYFMAVKGGNCGNVALKYAYDETNEVEPVSIQILDGAEHVRWYYDSEDSDKLLMARVQYPYYNYAEKAFYWHREDWTAETLQIYEDVPTKNVTSASYVDVNELSDSIDSYSDWQIATTEPNPFGSIPIQHIKNSETESVYGDGDLWLFWQLVDQINFTYNLANISNQTGVHPGKVYIDLKPESDDAPQGPNGGAGEAESLKSDSEDGGKQGKVELLEHQGHIREHLETFVNGLVQELFDSAGSVNCDYEEITNKGQMSTAVMKLLFAPLIDTTERKRRLYGEDGICEFFENMCKGLAKLGVKPFVATNVDIQIEWPPLLEMPEEEKSSYTNRLESAVEDGFVTQDWAARAFAKMEGVQDVDQVVKAALKEHEARKKEQHQNELALRQNNTPPEG